MSKQQAHKQLENALITNYLANLAFLSEYDKDLYTKIEEFSMLIDKGVYKERYILEFIEEDGDFDIYDTKNKKYFYDKKSKKYNKKLINEIDFDEENIINTLDLKLYKKEKLSTSNNIAQKKDKLQDALQVTQILKHEISNYLNIFDDKLNVHSKKKNFKRIEKFIFFGTMLGRHINPIAEKIDANLYFVCEKNLEIFRLSLFVNDYKNLAKKNGVIFSIMDDIKTLEEKINLFLEIKPFSNYCIKLSSTRVGIEGYIDSFLSSLVFTKSSYFDYNMMLYTVFGRLSQKLNSYKILELQNNNKNSPLSNLPILFIAGGPSLNESLDWLKKNWKKFFIVTIGAVYKTLVKNGIEVNMIISLDWQFDILNSLQFSSEDMQYIKNSILLCSTITDDRILNKFNQNRLFIYEVQGGNIIDKEILGCSSVGEKSVDLLLSMNAKEIYLLGLDLALDQNTGSTHARASDSGKTTYNLKANDLENRSIFGLRTGLVKVKGNFCKEVYTTSLFNQSIKCLDNILDVKLNKNFKVYNLSSSGAFFNKTKPTNINSLDMGNLKDKTIENSEVIEFLNNNSRKVLTKGEKNLIKEEMEYIKNIIFKEFFTLKKRKIENYEEFFNITNILTNKIIHDLKLSFFRNISFNYFDIVLNFLAYKFNDKKIEKEKVKIKKVRKIFYEQFEILLKDYYKLLEKIVA